MTLLVVAAGLQTLVQDRGRPGLAGLGVSPSGAFDRGAMDLANRIVGNRPGSAVLEVLGGGLRLRAGSPAVVGVAGATGPVRVNAVAADRRQPIRLETGDDLHVDSFATGLRGYVAVAGGVDVPDVLGSRARDTLAALGPAPLTAGDVLRIGATAPIDAEPATAPRDGDGNLTVFAIPGPRDDWFSTATVEALFSTVWRVSPQSSRVGIRLTGPPLPRTRIGELDSEPVVRGSIQVTSAGQPVILGPDHPVTGGYPVIAVVCDDDTDRLAQARPGHALRIGRKTHA